MEQWAIETQRWGPSLDIFGFGEALAPATIVIMFAAPVALSKLADLEQAISSTIRGKAEVIRLSLVCLLARGHLLIEDVPGVGKTTLAQALARSVDCRFHRLQFTSDMLPSDVLGVTIYNAHTEEFEFKPGPVFTNFLLADEINRTTPKTQSALLEAMNEAQVTIDGRSYPLAQPFMVIATQNPVEHHGTYPLPESQLDRFLMRLRIGYPDAAARARDPAAYARSRRVEPVRAGDGERRSAAASGARCSAWPWTTRWWTTCWRSSRRRASTNRCRWASARAARRRLFRATQALALVEGRDYAIPDDVKRLAAPGVRAPRGGQHARRAGAAQRRARPSASSKRSSRQVDVPL